MKVPSKLVAVYENKVMATKEVIAGAGTMRNAPEALVLDLDSTTTKCSMIVSSVESANSLLGDPLDSLV